MKIFFVFIFFLLTCLGNIKVYGQSQSPQFLYCNDTIRLDKCNYFYDNPKVFLEIKEGGEWRSYKFMDGSYCDLKANCSFKDLVEGRPKELVIDWESEVYATGAVSRSEGLQIWNLENPERIFQTINFCEDIEFGRPDDKINYWGIMFYQKISIGQGKIFVEPIQEDKKGSVDKYFDCTIDTLKPGTYKFTPDKKLKRISKSPLYIKNNEKFVLNFMTQTGNRLVIAKDTSNKYLVYRFGTESKIELEYPAQKENSWKHFKYSSKVRNEGSQNQGMDLKYLYFTRGNYKYIVYQEYIKKRITGIKVINLISKDTTNMEADLSYGIKGALKNLKDNENIIEGTKIFL